MGCVVWWAMITMREARLLPCAALLARSLLFHRFARPTHTPPSTAGGPVQQHQHQHQQQHPSPSLPSGLAPPGASVLVLDAVAARAQRAMGLGEGGAWLSRYPPGLQRLVVEVRGIHRQAGRPSHPLHNSRHRY